MRNKSTLPVYTVFGSSIFLSAFLLFQVQPLIGKYILPWFGGISFVWIVSLLFFQTMLLAGYLYAYLLTKISQRLQVYLHLLVVAGIACILSITFSLWKSPITPDITWKLPESFPPTLQVLHILTISIGLPYFLLSTTSTLLQRWFSLLPHKKSPYSLYALSNAGSLLGIISYPFFIEPFLSLEKQGFAWSTGFLTVCVLLSTCGVWLLLNGVEQPTQREIKKSSISSRRYGLWFFLPLVSSLMLLSGTNQMTQSIAPVPFLWLIPLGLYLLSFILCFSEKGWYKRNPIVYCFLIVSLFIIALFLQPVPLRIDLHILLYTLLLFSCFMICHGELYNSRPYASGLNKFYLVIATGSVIGASIVAIVAPVLFTGLFWEFFLGLFLTTLIGVAVLIFYEHSLLYSLLKRPLQSKKEMYAFCILVLCISYAIFSISSYLTKINNSIGVWRNFYGMLRITQNKIEKGEIRCLINGTIIHGCQFALRDFASLPTTYYGKKSGVGLAMTSLREKKGQQPLHIGSIGLGVGTIATYGKKGDTIRFYELNPLDISIAENKFSYLKNSFATINIVPGDGRLSLEKELKENTNSKFDLLIVDAFSDDAIPVHLLTKEAFAMYLRHMAPEGIIAVNISNAYVNLSPVLAHLSDYFNLQRSFVLNAEEKNTYETSSEWVLLSKNKAILQTKEINQMKNKNVRLKKIRLWTDDYSNVAELLKY